VINKPEVMVTTAAAKFDAELQLTDETARNLLRDLMANLVLAVQAQRKLEAGG
jgi:hypothetical protein